MNIEYDFKPEKGYHRDTSLFLPMERYIRENVYSSSYTTIWTEHRYFYSTEWPRNNYLRGLYFKLFKCK